MLLRYSKIDSAMGNVTYAFLQHKASGFWLSGAGPAIPQVSVLRVWNAPFPFPCLSLTVGVHPQPDCCVSCQGCVCHSCQSSDCRAIPHR